MSIKKLSTIIPAILTGAPAGQDFSSVQPMIALQSRSCSAGRCMSVGVKNAPRGRWSRLHSYDRRWPDPQFIQETKLLYEGLGMYAKPVADAEEARVLLSMGWVWLDVRPSIEVDKVGKVRGSVNIPFLEATKKYDPEQKTTVVTSTPNPTKFIQEVTRVFAKKDECLLLIADSNGRNGGQEALTLLEDAGYENLVGVVGGFNAFWRVFDAKLARRPSRGAFVEDEWSPGSSQGIFAGES